MAAAADPSLLASIRGTLATLAELKVALERRPPGASGGSSRQPQSQTGLQGHVNVCINRVVDGLRSIDRAAASATGTVDNELVEFVSGTGTSHPEILLQNRLQEAIDAKTAADVRCQALRDFAAALDVVGAGETGRKASGGGAAGGAT